MQNVLIAPTKMKYQNVWGLDFSVPVMNIKEICAEKIRAMSDRARYRDFYDMYLILDKYQVNLDEILEMVGTKEVRQTISKASILRNWQIILSQKKKEMTQIYYSREVGDSLIEEMINGIPYLSVLSRHTEK